MFEHFEVLGNSRPADREIVSQFADGRRAARKTFHYGASRAVGQGKPGIAISVSGHEP
jgi:hypothetical protein